ncbi:MAG: OmpA family protein [Pseudomonadales bacterium]|nr:OmpA family protein [Pseudomonadales bacterium]MCP5185260.1 OmpA family protein [Pseudomonadales bacterium]
MHRSTTSWLGLMCFSLIGASALYSCVPHIEEDLYHRSVQSLGDTAAPTGWAGIVVDGQEIVLSGVAPDMASRDRVIDLLASLTGVTVVNDITTLGGISPEAVAAAQVPETAASPPSGSLPPPVSTGASAIAGTATPTISADMNVPDPAEAVLSGLSGTDANRVPTNPGLSAPLHACEAEANRQLADSSSFFRSGGKELAAESLATLKGVAQLLAGCEASFEVAGYTDSSGKSGYNKYLSRERAKAVREALVAAGVDAARVTSAGYGEADPVASNATPQGRQQNRRIEIHIKPDGDGAMARDEESTSSSPVQPSGARPEELGA